MVNVNLSRIGTDHVRRSRGQARAHRYVEDTLSCSRCYLAASTELASPFWERSAISHSRNASPFMSSNRYGR